MTHTPAQVREEAERRHKYNPAAYSMLMAFAEMLEREPVAWMSERAIADLPNFDATAYGRGGFDDAVPLIRKDAP